MREEVREHGDPREPDSWQQAQRPDDPHDPYIGLTARLGLAYEEMYIRRLREALALLEASQIPS
jgi:hypothetical protein